MNEIAPPGDFGIFTDDDTLEANVAEVDTKLLPEVYILDDNIVVEDELKFDEYIVDVLQVDPLIDDKLVDIKHKQRFHGDVGLAIVVAGEGVGIFISTYDRGTGKVCN